MLCEVVDCLLVHVVSNNEPGLLGSFPWRQGSIKRILGDLNGARTIMTIVLRVDVIENDMVTHRTHVVQAARFGEAARVRWTHIGRNFPQNVAERSFILQDLLSPLLWCNFTEILVRPGVTRNLMFGALHALNQRGPWEIRMIYRALGIINSRDKERRLCVIPIQQVEKVSSVSVRTVIISQGNSA